MSEDKLFETIFTDYMDSIMQSFWENPETIYSETSKKKIVYDSISRTKRKHKSKRKCLVKNCDCLTIRRSHAISKGLFLGSIAEGDFVFSPVLDTSSNGKYVIKPVGLNEASTFPGFCEKHEELFHEFETKNCFSEERHYNLQLFRIICREYFIKTFRKETFEIFIDDYLRHRNKSFLAAYKNHPFGQLIESKGTQIKSIDYKGSDETEEFLKKELDNFNREIKEIAIFYEQSQSLLENDDKFFSHGFKIDIQFPVCLSGRANIKFSEKDKTINIVVFINVLPTKSETTIYISSLKENESYVKLYLNEVLSDVESLINLIETWMICGTDHWFIKPSVWKDIESKMQEEILSDMHDLRYNIGTPYLNRIFNELREQIKAVNIGS